MTTSRVKVKRQTGWVDRLWYAVEFNDVKTVKRLLANGADVNHAFRQVRTEQGHKRHRQTALFIAVRKNYVTLVDVLLSAGSDVNKTDDRSETPLFIAVYRGNTKLARRLLDAGADADYRNHQGETPAHVAVKQGHVAVLDYLIKAGCDLSVRSGAGCTPLMAAVLLHADAHDGRVRTRRRQRHGQGAIIERLVRGEGADLDALMAGCTALHAATALGTACGDFSAAACLLQHGAWPDVRDAAGQSPLAITCCPTAGRSPTYLSPNLIRLLVDAGARPASERWLAAEVGVGACADVLCELRRRSQTPRSLACGCRLVIRRALGVCLWAKIDRLPVPAIIRDRLKLADVNVDDAIQVS